jgi:hypothetical protein
MKNYWIKKNENNTGDYSEATFSSEAKLHDDTWAHFPIEPLERAYKKMNEENARLLKAMREMIGETKSFRAWAGIILGSELD